MPKKKKSDVHPVYALAKSGQYLDTKDLAVLARAALKKRWPKFKFSVTISRYSMGSSLRVGWEDGPLCRDVEALLSPLNTGGFDGMIDMTYDRDFWLMPDGSFSYAGTEGTQGSMGVIPEIKIAQPSPDAIKPGVVRCNVGLSRDMSVTTRRTLSEFVLHHCRPVYRIPCENRMPLSEEEIKLVTLDREGFIDNALVWGLEPYPEHLSQVVRELFNGVRKIEGSPFVFAE